MRVIGASGEQLGVLTIDQALSRAQEEGMDLVEVSPLAKPPVCKIMDYGKFKYLEKKKQNEAKKNQVVVLLKEIKFRPRTEEHDYNVKIKKVREFLEDSNKARITVMFRGREMSHRELGQKVLQEIIEDLKDVAVIEAAPRMEGRQMFMILAPNPKMLQAQRSRAEAAAKAAKFAAEEPALAAGAAAAAPAEPAPAEAAPAPAAPGRRPNRSHGAATSAARTPGREERPEDAQAQDQQRRQEALPGEEVRRGEVPPRRRPPPGDLREDPEAEARPPRHQPPGRLGRQEDQGVLPVRPLGVRGAPQLPGGVHKRGQSVASRRREE